MRKYVLFLLLILCCLPAMIPLFHPGFFVSDDGTWMIIRFSAFYDTLRHGQFPVRFLFRLNNGFGYPVADFLYPLFMYIGVPIHVIGFNFMTTIKVIFGISLLSSGLCAFFWLKKLFSQHAAFLGSLLYVYFPYHLFDIYNRGSIGESLALGVVPFIFWQIERKSLIFISLGIALLIIAHNTLALLFLPIICAYILLKRLPPRFVILCLLIGVGLASFFWLPALFDQQYTVFSHIQISDVSSYFLTEKNITLIGLPLIIILLQAVYYWFSKPNMSVLFFLFVSFFAFLFVLPVTALLWKISPLTPFIQFPWRLLSLVILSSSFLISYIIDQVKKNTIFILVFYILLIILSVVPFLTKITYQYFPDSYYATNTDTTTVKSEYMPKWVNQGNLTYPSQDISIIQGRGEVINSNKSGAQASGTVYFLSSGKVRIHVVYFPGIQVMIDSKRVEIQYAHTGLVEVAVPAGRHEIRIFYQETTVQIIADIISAATVLYLSFIIFTKKRYV